MTVEAEPQTHFALPYLPRTGFDRIAGVVGGHVSEGRRQANSSFLRGEGCEKLLAIVLPEAVTVSFFNLTKSDLPFHDATFGEDFPLRYSVHFFNKDGPVAVEKGDISVTFVKAQQSRRNPNTYAVVTLDFNREKPEVYQSKKEIVTFSAVDKSPFAEAVRLANRLNSFTGSLESRVALARTLV